ncbi:MAG: HPr kinase [Nevskia sp.]|nr:HPr kinase [Nevskia sp.]
MPEMLTHGVLVAVEDLGLLLRGASGTGKSELAIELLSRGHKLIADDAVEWRRDSHGRIIGSCPALLSGFIEVRGLGVLDARALYGKDSVIAEAALDLVIDLGVRADPSAEERLSGRRGIFTLLDRPIPEISLPRRVGHNLAVLVEAACRDHRLRLAGYRADEVLVERQLRRLESNDDIA